MAKETRQVVQYKVYLLFKTIQKPHGKRFINERSQVAFFDDKKLLDAYLTQAKGEENVVYETNEEWLEIEPKPENFSLTLNPEYVAPEVKTKKSSKVAGLEKLKNK